MGYGFGHEFDSRHLHYTGVSVGELQYIKMEAASLFDKCCFLFVI